jgi:hypothetical protein
MFVDLTLNNKFMDRNLSGIYFREQRDGHWDNVCFEDCSEAKQDKILETEDVLFLKNLCKELAKSLKELGDFVGITKE